MNESTNTFQSWSVDVYLRIRAMIKKTMMTFLEYLLTIPTLGEVYLILNNEVKNEIQI